jgi:hypothetical protein
LQGPNAQPALLTTLSTMDDGYRSYQVRRDRNMPQFDPAAEVPAPSPQ